MGYELHITRKADWADTETLGISIEEWMCYVHSDQELELTNQNNIKTGLEKEFQNRPGYCVWNAHPSEKESNARPWFDYWEGNIDTKHPDVPTIRKMIRIALALNAKVQGDDGEYYTEEYLAELESAKKQKALVSRQEKKVWWKFW